MARYDRIARLAPPSRAEAFPAWLVLRDLEGRERDPQLKRRARLRFLALRPAHRLIHRGFHAVERRSLDRQVTIVREDLVRLPDTDPERKALSFYLDAVSGRDPEGIATAAMAVGGITESAGHLYAAEEFYRTAQETAELARLPAVRFAAASALGRLFGSRREWPEARQHLEAALAVAEEMGDLDELDRTLRDLVLVLVRADDRDHAHAAIDAFKGDTEGTDSRLDGIRAAARCTIEAAAGRHERAIEAGWQALQQLEADSLAYARVLMDVGSSLRRLGLSEAAEACDLLVSQNELPDRLTEEARIRSNIGAADVIDDAAEARTLLDEALASARRARLGLMIPVIEDQLSRLASGDPKGPGKQEPQISENARGIASRIATLGQQLVASGN